MAENHYVRNKDLVAEIIRCKETDILSNQAILYFKKIAEQLATRLRYKSKEDREDCIQSGILDACLYWRSFDPDKSGFNLDGSKKQPNAFSYYTMVILMGMTKTWNKLHPINSINQISISDQAWNI